MAKLSLSKAWDETKGVVSRDGKLIATVALAMFFLPGVIVGVMEPEAKPIPVTMTDAVVAIVLGLIAVIGQLAIIRMALGSRLTVGEAIGHGARRTPAYFAAGLLWAGPLAVAGYFAFGGGDAFRAPESATGGQVAAAFLVLMVMLVIGVRMMMTSPVASSEQGGPIDILKRSWALTSGHWWKLFGLLCVFLLLIIIVMAAVGAVVGIVSRILFDPIEPMTVGALFIAVCTQLVSAIFTTGLLVMLARIYVQLCASPSASVPSSGT